jgi:oligopeptide transport system substrate-binding protein
MRLLAYSDQRGAALAQYETCRRVLAEELGVEPAAETTQLYEQIRDGDLEVPASFPHLPAPPPPFLDEEGPAERPVFVARERELGQLQGFLDQALAGQGRVVFVTGDAGSGKTALIQEFARRAQAAHPDLVVASGHGNAHTGVGDPYLPFREILALLTGDVEARWAAGAMSSDQARRLWHTLPLAAQTLVEAGPDLIDLFVPGAALVKRAVASAPVGADWLPQLQELVERTAAASGDLNLQQSALFEQYTRVVETLARQRPLLLVLDDLQWADTGSVSLLFHLGRRIEGSRVLILGAYRPTEVALGRPVSSLLVRKPPLSSPPQAGGIEGGRERHPLEPVVNEFKRYFGDIVVDLLQAEDRQFIDALLDTEPNRLGDAFRQTLYRQTRGHPLFTVELLRGMRERGDLIQDQQGRWVEEPTLDWDRLPARVEAVIAERIGRLPEELRDALTVASVEGETFTAEVVAQVRLTDEQEMIQHLSGKLDREHHLVNAQGIRRMDGQSLSLYRFRHILFQRYLYNSLDPVERAHLHQAVGTALEALSGEGEEEIAALSAQLARHFQEAGIATKAVDYLCQAGDQARGLYAYQEAIDYYQRALASLKEQGEYERAARTLMKLGLTYHNAFDFRRARQAYEESFALWQQAGEMEPDVLPPPPHALRQACTEPLVLDPTVAYDAFSVPVIPQLFSGLVDLSPELNIVPGVARSWEVGAGGRQYVFHLRDDVRWSDGSLLTAEDFAFAWRRLLDPATGAVNSAPLLYDVKGAQAFHQGQTSAPGCLGIQVLDPLTLVVELEQPTAYFLHLLACLTAYPVPRHVVVVHGEAWTEVGKIVSNGPFRLEAWERGESMVLVRNPAYYGRFRGNVQRVELSFLTDRPATLAKYEADDLDVLDLWGFTQKEMYRAQQRHAGEYVSIPDLGTYYLGFDVSRPPFDDVRVRRALALAVDKETLTSINPGLLPATGGFVPLGMPGHSAGISLAYDPERARQLLAEAGYSKGGDRGFPPVTMLCPGHRPLPARVSEHLCAQWRENLGVEITWEAMEFGALGDRLHRNPPPIFYYGWTADYPDPDNFLRVCPDCTGWQNAAYEELVEEAKRVTDQAARMRLYNQADKILVEEAAIIPLAYGQRYFLVKPWVKKYPMSPGIKSVSWKDVIIEPH